MNVQNLIMALSVETQPISSQPQSDADGSFSDLLGSIQSTLGEISSEPKDTISHGPGLKEPAEESSEITQQPGPFGEGEVTALIGLPVVIQETVPQTPVPEVADEGLLCAPSVESATPVVQEAGEHELSAHTHSEQTVVPDATAPAPDVSGDAQQESPQAAPAAPQSEVTRAEPTAVTPERSQAVFSYADEKPVQETQPQPPQPLAAAETQPLPKTNKDGMTVEMASVEELPTDTLASMLGTEIPRDMRDRIEALLAQEAPQELQAEVQPEITRVAAAEGQDAFDAAAAAKDGGEVETDVKAPKSAQEANPVIAAQQAEPPQTQPVSEPVFEAAAHISQVPKQLSDFIVGARGEDSFTIHMKLQPEGMGELHVKVLCEKGQVSLQILASSEAAGDMLRQGGHELGQNLEQRGYTLQSLDVGLSDGGSAQQDREQSFNNYFSHYASEGTDDIVVIPNAYAAAVRAQGMYYTA